MRKHHRNHSSEHYYAERSKKYRSPIRKAARTLYLNRTCWNGLYRVNLRGEFNVPIGTKKGVLYESDDFSVLSNRLKCASFATEDFEKAIERAGPKDFIFADPPYTVKHNSNGFVKYNERIFSWEDQVRLRNCLLAAKRRGAKILLTNADHVSIRELYASGFMISTVQRASVIAASNIYRGRTTELVIR